MILRLTHPGNPGRPACDGTKHETYRVSIWSTIQNIAALAPTPRASVQTRATVYLTVLRTPRITESTFCLGVSMGMCIRHRKDSKRCVAALGGAL